MNMDSDDNPQDNGKHTKIILKANNVPVGNKGNTNVIHIILLTNTENTFKNIGVLDFSIPLSAAEKITAGPCMRYPKDIIKILPIPILMTALSFVNKPSKELEKTDTKHANISVVTETVKMAIKTTFSIRLNFFAP